MERRIDEALENPKIGSQADLKDFIKNIQSKIVIYEKNLYEKELYNPETAKKIRGWRLSILRIIKENKQLPEEKEDNTQEKAGVETLKLLNKQISLADTNQKILEKSTLKLLQLDYTLSELDKIIFETGKKFEDTVKTETFENRRLTVAIVIFVTVCIGILIDKIRCKFL